MYPLIARLGVIVHLREYLVMSGRYVQAVTPDAPGHSNPFRYGIKCPRRPYTPHVTPERMTFITRGSVRHRALLSPPESRSSGTCEKAHGLTSSHCVAFPIYTSSVILFATSLDKSHVPWEPALAYPAIAATVVEGFTVSPLHTVGGSSTARPFLAVLSINIQRSSLSICSLFWRYNLSCCTRLQLGKLLRSR